MTRGWTLKCARRCEGECASPLIPLASPPELDPLLCFYDYTSCSERLLITISFPSDLWTQERQSNRILRVQFGRSREPVIESMSPSGPVRDISVRNSWLIWFFAKLSRANTFFSSVVHTHSQRMDFSQTAKSHSCPKVSEQLLFILAYRLRHEKRRKLSQQLKRYN